MTRLQGGVGMLEWNVIKGSFCVSELSSSSVEQAEVSRGR